MGGFALNGNSRYINCNSAFGNDAANCDDNATFRASLVTSEATGVDFYDDYVFSKGQTSPNFAIPEGAIVAFDSACPTGWSRYAPAEGRFIMGEQGGATITVNPSVTVTSGGSITVATTTLNNTDDGDPTVTIPRHIALTYCRKDAD